VIANEPAPLNVAQLLKVFQAELVDITPGIGKFPQAFSMGSVNGPGNEQPLHTVKLEHDFSIAKYEVPQNLYEAVMGTNPSRWKGPRNSVEEVSWSQAGEFCRRVTKLLRAADLIGQNEAIRLPSEAEWEYCCRAGTTTEFSFGPTATGPDDRGPAASLLDEYGWHTGNAAGNDPPVGARKPNGWGLYDMHGYLSEFVSDSWHDNYHAAPANGRSWKNADNKTQRLTRGGSWRDHYSLLRSAARRKISSDATSDAVGFRCVKALVPVQNAR
jgi:formylglycine-generating enzyme required for sulfatase activity